MTSDGLFWVAAALAMALCMSPSFAQKFDTGATDTEISAIRLPPMPHRQDAGSLSEDNQRLWWHQRPQAQFDPV
jgi:hypothetical protein